MGIFGSSHNSKTESDTFASPTSSAGREQQSMEAAQPIPIRPVRSDASAPAAGNTGNSILNKTKPFASSFSSTTSSSPFFGWSFHNSAGSSGSPGSSTSPLSPIDHGMSHHRSMSDPSVLEHLNSIPSKAAVAAATNGTRGRHSGSIITADEAMNLSRSGSIGQSANPRKSSLATVKRRQSRANSGSKYEGIGLVAAFSGGSDF